MTDPTQAPVDASDESSGLTIRRSWPVWANQVQHRVDIELNAITGSARVHVDGELAAKRSPWHMNMSGFELPFDVDGRPCLLVVRAKYGAQPEIDLYSEGRSLSTGDTLEVRREAAGRELPNLVRMLLIFIPAIGLFSVLRETTPNALAGLAPLVMIAVALAAAGGGWFLASRWYARGSDSPSRHLVGGAIVAAAWAVFFGTFVVVVLLERG